VDVGEQADQQQDEPEYDHVVSFRAPPRRRNRRDLAQGADVEPRRSGERCWTRGARVPHNWHSTPESAKEDDPVPTYQYACTACDEQLEAVQSFTDAALTECPACGGALRKVFSAVGVVFKGSGFYKTDSRATSSESGEKKADAPKTETKSDTKTGTKTDTKTGGKPAAATSSTSTPAAKTA
jgi:putative FmdB family regulatory protein